MEASTAEQILLAQRKQRVALIAAREGLAELRRSGEVNPHRQKWLFGNLAERVKRLPYYYFVPPHDGAAHGYVNARVKPDGGQEMGVNIDIMYEVDAEGHKTASYLSATWFDPDSPTRQQIGNKEAIEASALDSANPDVYQAIEAQLIGLSSSIGAIESRAVSFQISEHMQEVPGTRIHTAH